MASAETVADAVATTEETVGVATTALTEAAVDVAATMEETVAVADMALAATTATTSMAFPFFWFGMAETTVAIFNFNVIPALLFL